MQASQIGYEKTTRVILSIHLIHGILLQAMLFVPSVIVTKSDFIPTELQSKLGKHLHHQKARVLS